MTKKLLFVSTILLALAVAAMAADVSGKWTYETQMGRGGGGGTPIKVTLTLKAEGAKLTGNISQPGRDGAAMETPISDGKVDGNNISFKVVRQFQDMTFTTDYSGALAGEDLKLKITRPGRGGGDPTTTEVTAKRATT
jgi:hypothetical protein